MQNNESWSRKLLLPPTNSWTSCRCTVKVLSQIARMSYCLSHPIHISLSHICKILSLSTLSLLSRSSFPHLSSQLSIIPSLALSVWRRDSRLQAQGFCGMQGPALGHDKSALQWFLLFGVCVFPEKPLVCRLPLVLFLKHTQMYSECKCMSPVYWLAAKVIIE